MTYSSQEISLESGRPVEVYEFALGSEYFRFNSGEDTITVDGNSYPPLEISRTTIVVSQEQQGDLISVKLPARTALVRKYINVVPGQQGTLSIFRIHRGDVDEEFELIFKGLVRSVAFTLNGLDAEIAIQPLTSGLSRTIPRFVYSSICNHVLYDTRCKVNSNLFRYQDDITDITGSAYTINGLSAVERPDGWATGGFVVSPNGTDYRLIIDHTGDVLTLLLPFPEDVRDGQTVEIFAGCQHDIDTCSSKFDNITNFGGYNWVPRENVFVKGL